MLAKFVLQPDISPSTAAVARSASARVSFESFRSESRVMSVAEDAFRLELPCPNCMPVWWKEALSPASKRSFNPQSKALKVPSKQQFKIRTAADNSRRQAQKLGSFALLSLFAHDLDSFQSVDASPPSQTGKLFLQRSSP